MDIVYALLTGEQLGCAQDETDRLRGRRMSAVLLLRVIKGNLKQCGWNGWQMGGGGRQWFNILAVEGRINFAVACKK